MRNITKTLSKFPHFISKILNIYLDLSIQKADLKTNLKKKNNLNVNSFSKSLSK